MRLTDLFLAGNDDYKTFSSVYLRKVQTRCLKSFLIECISRLRRDEKKGEKGSGKTVKCETKRAGRGNAKHLRSRGPEVKPGQRQFRTFAPGYGSATIYGSIWVGPDLNLAKNYENWDEFSAGSRSKSLQGGMEKVMPDKVSKKYVKAFF